MYAREGYNSLGYNSRPVYLSICHMLWVWRLLTINCWFSVWTHSEEQFYDDFYLFFKFYFGLIFEKTWSCQLHVGTLEGNVPYCHWITWAYIYYSCCPWLFALWKKLTECWNWSFALKSYTGECLWFKFLLLAFTSCFYCSSYIDTK